jgi:putative zincin peptidase
VTDTTTESAAAPPGSDATISFEAANVIALLYLPLAAAPVVAHAALWGGASLGEGLRDLFPWAFLPAFAASVVAHEALHAAGFLLLGRAPRRAIRFGLDRATLSPFAGCRVPLRAGAYRAAVLLPALVLGVGPAAWGLWKGAGWATLWGAFMLLCAGGDFAVLWAMRRVPARARVLDHPERVGCRVVEE